MRILLFSFLFLSFSSLAQVTVKFEMGGETHEFKGYRLFTGNDEESTYYNIEDGQFHYYYVNEYNGKCIQYEHISCPVKKMDIKSANYKAYDTFGQFLYIDMKKMEQVVLEEEYRDGDLSGPSNKENITFEQMSGRSLFLIVNDKEQGQKVLDQIKSGKNL